jgi:hypothetical protein
VKGGVTLHLTLGEASDVLEALSEIEMPAKPLRRAISKLIDRMEAATKEVRVRPSARRRAEPPPILEELPPCLICHGPVEGKDHPAAPTKGVKRIDYACNECFRNLFAPVPPPPPPPESLRCGGCGAAWGGGCSCASNKLAIGRGERAKAMREER